MFAKQGKTLFILTFLFISILSSIFIVKEVAALPPNPPYDPSPNNGKTNVSITTNLSWTCTDPDNDTITYDVYFGTANPPVENVSNNQSTFSFDPGPLDYNTVYYWTIVAWDNNGEFSRGSLWSFTTQAQTEYTLTLSTNGTGSGSIHASPGPYHFGDIVTIWANASVGSTFSGFSGALTGTTTPQTLNMDENEIVSAMFTQNEYTLSVSLVGFGSVVKLPNQVTYHYGDTVQLTAIADPGWTFTRWNGDLSGNTNPTTITMDSNKTITATFTQNEYTLSITTDGSGSVSKNPNKATYHYGDSVLLNATANLGWDFSHWTGDITGSTNPVPLTITKNTVVTAIFTQNEFTLTVIIIGQGSVVRNPDQLTYPAGTIVQLTASGNPDWVFKEWSGDLGGTDNQTNITIDGNKAVTATFIQPPNTPPNMPSNPAPSNGAPGISITTSFSWTGGDPDQADTVNYDVYFGTTNLPAKVASNQSASSYYPAALAYTTSYYWMIVAWDNHGVSTSGPLWNFTTGSNDGGGGGGSGGEENPPPSSNDLPKADASAGEPYQGFVNSTIIFDGSSSNDTDGTITTWFWVFGDNSNGIGRKVNHTFSKTGTYLVRLTVTDNEGATSNDTTTCVIKQPNRPPEKPTIIGPTSGTKHTMYNFTVLSSDPDGDSIQYTFNWGDSLSQPSGFLPNATRFTINHRWTAAGRYRVIVTVSDNQTESSSEIFVYIDALQTRGVGYLLDNNSDGIYDAFYSDESKQTVATQKKDGIYLIDSDKDGTWDYTYDDIKGIQSYPVLQKTPGFEIIIALGAIATVVLLRQKLKKER